MNIQEFSQEIRTSNKAMHAVERFFDKYLSDFPYEIRRTRDQESVSCNIFDYHHHAYPVTIPFADCANDSTIFNDVEKAVSPALAREIKKGMHRQAANPVLTDNQVYYLEHKVNRFLILTKLVPFQPWASEAYVDRVNHTLEFNYSGPSDLYNGRVLLDLRQCPHPKYKDFINAISRDMRKRHDHYSIGNRDPETADYFEFQRNFDAEKKLLHQKRGVAR